MAYICTSSTKCEADAHKERLCHRSANGTAVGFFLWSKNDGWIQDCESVWGMNSWVCLIFTGFFFVYQHC